MQPAGIWGVDQQILFASEIIGVSREHLTQILNGKSLCTKYLAFAITKYLDEDAEIEDFFEREK